MYHKSGQACVTNWGQVCFITNQGKLSYKFGQLLQIRATVIAKQRSYYKLGKNVLQIGTGITNQSNYYKLGHSNIAHDKRFVLHSGIHTLAYFDKDLKIRFTQMIVNKKGFKKILRNGYK